MFTQSSRRFYVPLTLISALVISNAVMFVVGVMIMWCSFDVAGRDWVKLKKYQKSLKNQAWMMTSYIWQPLKGSKES